jgi:5'-3' exonuclease
MKLLLVDGHYYLYRSFFAIRGLTNSAGQPTNAIYAFTKALRKMLADLRPTHGVVLWDAGLPPDRVALQPEYKSQRPPMPDDLQAQEQSVMDLCPMLGLPSLSVPGVEADDLIASYARLATNTIDPCEVFIATSDKDILQVVTERVRIYSTAKNDLAHEPEGSGFALLGPAEVAAKWGVPPEGIVEVLSLTGDAVDNISGVPGVGEKTAARLIQQFGSVAALLAGLEQVENAKLREKLAAYREQILSNYEMVRLRRDETLPQPLESLALAPQPAALLEFLRACEFRSLVRELETELAPEPIFTTPLTTRPTQGELF